MSQNSNPTAEQIRKARHSGFQNSIGHLPEDRRSKLTEKYQKQDAARERNVGGFYKQIRDAKK